MRLIDADAFMEKVCGNCQQNYCVPDATDTVYGCELADSIDQMPTIEAEPVRHGRWNPHRITCSSMCSECKKYVAYETPRCPYCGARMDGGADNG